eukprot:3185724-Rhodomonas_salina.2
MIARGWRHGGSADGDSGERKEVEKQRAEIKREDPEGAEQENTEAHVFATLFIARQAFIALHQQTTVPNYSIRIWRRRLKYFWACERTCAAVRDPIISESIRATPGPSLLAPSLPLKQLSPDTKMACSCADQRVEWLTVFLR